MRRIAPFFLAFAGAALASAFQAASPPRASPAPAPLLALEGTVKGPDGKPVADARVLARSSAASFADAPLSGQTDAEGRFRIVVKSAALHTVRVEAKGLAARSVEKVRAGTPLAVALEKGVWIEGLVRDGGSGEPVPGARVEAREEGLTISLPGDPRAGVVEALTDAKGRYRLESLAPGLHSVSASARGYGRAQRPSIPTGGRADFFLLPGSSVSGIVSGPDAKPVKGAVVRVESDSLRPIAPRPEITSEQGQFEIVGVEPGAYRLVARHADFAPGVVSGVLVDPRSETRADLVLSAGSRLVGRLVSPTGEPSRGRVTIQQLDGAPPPRSLMDLLRAEAGADGRFRLDSMPPGFHTLGVSAPGFAPQRTEISVREGDAETDAGDVLLEAGLAIRGRITDRAGSPIADARVSGFPVRAIDPSSQVEDRSAADGSFVLSGLNPGAYRLNATAPGFGDVSRQAESGSEGLELVLRPAGSITGVVVDESGRPIESYRVSARAARPEPGQPSPLRSKSVGSPDGRFVLEDIAEGAHVVEVTAPDRAPGAVSNVAVSGGVATDVGRIRLSGGGSVRGSVVDQGGASIAGASVSVRGAGRSFLAPGAAQAVSDASGAFEVRGVPPGTVDVVATHPAFAEGRVSGIDVDPAKGPAEARVVLTQGGRVEGSVRKRDGTGIPRTMVQVAPVRPGLGAVYSSTGMVPTGPDGSFVVEHVPAGRAQALLMAGTGGMFTSGQSREIEVREGETTLVEFVSRDILVSGRVTRSGAPAPNLRLNLRGAGGGLMMSMSVSAGVAGGGSPQGPQRMSAVTREDGSYELLVDDAGRFIVTTETLDGRLRLPTRTIEVPDADFHTADLTFTGVPVSGIVVDGETEQPIAEASVSFSPKQPGAPGASGGGSAMTSSDGHFQLELDPGDYRVRARGPAHVGEALDLSIGSAGVSGIRLVVARGLTLSGRVVDARGRGAGELTVMATPSAAQPAASGGAGRTLPDGTFRIEGLGEGAYNLLARSNVGSFAYRPNVPAGAENVALTLRPGGRLVIQLQGPEGPVQGAYGTVSRLGGAPIGGIGSSSSSDARGVLEMLVPAGLVDIRVSKERLRGEATVDVAGGAVLPVEMKLSATPPPKPEH